VAARVETLAKLGQGAAGGSSSTRLDVYRQALAFALEKLADARARPGSREEPEYVLPLREGAPTEDSPTMVFTPPAESAASTDAPPEALSPEEASRILAGLDEPEIEAEDEASETSEEGAQ
jgi:hypothetical protein